MHSPSIFYLLNQPIVHKWCPTSGLLDQAHSSAVLSLGLMKTGSALLPPYWVWWRALWRWLLCLFLVVISFRSTSSWFSSHLSDIWNEIAVQPSRMNTSISRHFNNHKSLRCKMIKFRTKYWNVRSKHHLWKMSYRQERVKKEMVNE